MLGFKCRMKLVKLINMAEDDVLHRNRTNVEVIVQIP